ncbi:MAG: ClpXP protease specificity-enhancing factor SspB [Pseudomonadota bacterium]
MSGDGTIDYESLMQDAMRDIVRRVLLLAANEGLPGEHHFYISFDTLAPGVILSKRLRDKYAEEMTIVLQHRFWDLEVNQDRFEVKLTFDGIPERLVIPYNAIKVFFDPSIRYGLQFDTADLLQDPRPSPGLGGRDAPFDAMTLEPSSVDALGVGEREAGEPHTSEDDLIKRTVPAIVASRAADDQSSPDQDPPANEEDDAEEQQAGAEIVSLDAFRKK